MMTSQVSLSGKFYSVVARGEMPHATVLSDLQQINQQDWCPSPYNHKDAFIKACLAHRDLIAQRLSVVLGKRISHLQIEFKEHRDSSVNGWEWVYVDKAASKNDYSFIASAKLQQEFENIAIHDDLNSCVSPGLLNAAYVKNLRTISGGSVGKLLRRLGECLEKLGCGQYLSSGFFWISDKAPDHVHDNNHYYEAWLDVIKVLRKVASDTGSTLRVRCLDVTPDEDSYGMVTDAIQDSISKKVSKLQELFDLDKTQPEDNKLTDRELKTKSKEVAVISKQLEELDSRLNLGNLMSSLQTALGNAQQDCAILQSQAKSRSHNSNRSMMRRQFNVRRPSVSPVTKDNI